MSTGRIRLGNWGRNRTEDSRQQLQSIIHTMEHEKAYAPRGGTGESGAEPLPTLPVSAAMPKQGRTAAAAVTADYGEEIDGKGRKQDIIATEESPPYRAIPVSPEIVVLRSLPPPLSSPSPSSSSSSSSLSSSSSSSLLPCCADSCDSSLSRSSEVLSGFGNEKKADGSHGEFGGDRFYYRGSGSDSMPRSAEADSEGGSREEVRSGRGSVQLHKMDHDSSSNATTTASVWDIESDDDDEEEEDGDGNGDEDVEYDQDGIDGEDDDQTQETGSTRQQQLPSEERTVASFHGGRCGEVLRVRRSDSSSRGREHGRREVGSNEGHKEGQGERAQERSPWRRREWGGGGEENEGPARIRGGIIGRTTAAAAAAVAAAVVNAARSTLSTTIMDGRLSVGHEKQSKVPCSPDSQPLRKEPQTAEETGAAAAAAAAAAVLTVVLTASPPESIDVNVQQFRQGRREQRQHRQVEEGSCELAPAAPPSAPAATAVENSPSKATEDKNNSSKNGHDSNSSSNDEGKKRGPPSPSVTASHRRVGLRPWKERRTGDSGGGSGGSGAVRLVPSTRPGVVLDSARMLMPPPPPNLVRAKMRRRRSRVCLMHSARYQRLCGLVERNGRRDDLLYALVGACGLLGRLKVVAPARATDAHLRAYHDREYVEALRDPPSSDTKALDEFGLLDDCEVFEEMFDYCCAVAGASLHAANLLAKREADVAINWGGGRHHAKKGEAAGFCYVNDVVLAVLHMTKRFRRVLTIDIDVHHGDGMQDAFYMSDKVMTVSFHHLGKGFFPGGGGCSETGAGKGRGFNLNVPLKQGCGDNTFMHVFSTTLSSVVEAFRPEAAVLLCGADTLAADPLGPFNLTSGGVRACVEQVVALDIPLLLLGGGGYCPTDTARMWTTLTAAAVGPEALAALPVSVPDHAYFPLYGPDFRLATKPKTLKDNNDSAFLAELGDFATQATRRVASSLARENSLELTPCRAYDDACTVDGDSW